MINPFAVFRKIDAHSHIGMFGAPFNVNFNAEMLSAQMEDYNIERTIFCPAAAHLNVQLLEVFHQMPDKVITLYWVNANLGQLAYDDKTDDGN